MSGVKNHLKDIKPYLNVYSRGLDPSVVQGAVRRQPEAPHL